MWADLRLARAPARQGARVHARRRSALALGIAANNTVFTIVNGVLLRDLPFDASGSDRQLGVGNRRMPQTRCRRLLARCPRLARRRRARSTGIAAFSEQTMNVSEEGLAPERFRARSSRRTPFALIGARPVLGRDFRRRRRSRGRSAGRHHRPRRVAAIATVATRASSAARFASTALHHRHRRDAGRISRFPALVQSGSRWPRSMPTTKTDRTRARPWRVRPTAARRHARPGRGRPSAASLPALAAQLPGDQHGHRGAHGSLSKRHRRPDRVLCSRRCGRRRDSCC